MLRKLLQSKNPEDLRAANRLIRDMVRRVSLHTTATTHVHTPLEHYIVTTLTGYSWVVKGSEGACNFPYAGAIKA